MNLNLTGQQAKADQFRPYLVAFRNEIELRWSIWQKLDRQKRKQWIVNADTIDPLFGLFVDVVRYSRKWLVDEDDDG